MSLPNGLGLTPEMLAAIKAQQQQVQIASPMNDVQLIALVAGSLYANADSYPVSTDRLLDLATEMVAGAYARVAGGRFNRALEAARLLEQAKETVSA